MNRVILSFVLYLMIASFPGNHLLLAQDQPPAWAAPSIDRAVSVRNGRTGELLSWEEMVKDLSQADVVFLGETHLDETTHRVELAVFESMLALRDGQAVLSMEMFERDVQKHLDAYLAGETDEATFLSRARPWGNYRSAYRPLVEAARKANAPVVAANFPTPLRRRMAMEGNQVLEKLQGEEKATIPRKLIPNTKDYWERVDNAVRGHLAMMFGGSRQDDKRLYSTQTLWDNAMGEACANAMDDHPGRIVVHVNGGFHTAYWQGTARQLLLRKPDAKVKTVSIDPSANPAIDDPSGVPVADYVVFASEIAADINEGKYSVTVANKVHYKFSLPPSISAGQKIPLLIWMGDDGLNSTDGMDLWKQTLGDQVAIAVFDPRYKEMQGDLSIGGRWFWPDSFTEDIESSETSVENAWGYLLRNFPIDPERVCVAGEGTGGTVAAAIALRTDRMMVQAVASNPRQFTKLKDFPLSLPKYWGDDAPPKRELVVLGPKKIEPFWTAELEAYRDSNINAQYVTAQSDPWLARSQLIDSLGDALKLELPDPGDVRKKYVLADGFSTRGVHWARIQSQLDADAAVVVVSERPADESATELELKIDPDAFAVPGVLPPCPGPFGGTTVLVLPKDVSEGDLQKWIALEKDDPLTKTNRFRRLRVATNRGDRQLRSVLQKLTEKNRNNVLIVPVTFCADSNTMQVLKQTVEEFDDTMTFNWLPGLGGRKGLQGGGSHSQ